MTPKQIRNQIVRRALTDDGIDPRVFEAFDIDPDAEPEGDAELAYPPLVDDDTDDDIIQGVVPFELQVGVLGRMHTLDCRAIYTATLTDDGSFMAICTDVIGECEIAYQILTWQPRTLTDAPRPGWVPIEPGQLFPRDIRLLIRALIENDALRRQENDS